MYASIDHQKRFWVEHTKLGEQLQAREALHLNVVYASMVHVSRGKQPK